MDETTQKAVYLLIREYEGNGTPEELNDFLSSIECNPYVKANSNNVKKLIDKFECEPFQSCNKCKQ